MPHDSIIATAVAHNTLLKHAEMLSEKMVRMLVDDANGGGGYLR
jgi:hypothetical protein